MKLAVICDWKINDVFDQVKNKTGYRVGILDGVECLLLDTTVGFDENIKIAKDLGVEELLELSDILENDEKESMATENGISYTGFFVKGKVQYIRPIISSAVFASGASKIELLTEREQEVLDLLADGFSNKDIAKRLFLSEKTVKNHLNTIFKKMEVTDRTNAALYAIKAKNI